MAFWAKMLEKEKGNVEQIINDFGNSPEYRDRFGHLGNTELVNNIYQQLLGRPADQGGLDFYVGKLASGELSLASIALDIHNGVKGGDDQLIVNNKLLIARVYTHRVAANELDYGNAEIADAKALLDEVTFSADSLATAQLQLRKLLGLPEFDCSQTVSSYEDTENYLDLMADCEWLLAGKGTLDVYSRLNWDVSIDITEWVALSGVDISAEGRLTGLDLGGRELSGSIPVELGNLSNLQNLRLHSTKLRGPIPAELGNLSNLERLSLYFNQLSGSIPIELGNLSNLVRLYLDDNQLSGPIPAILGNLSNLWRLYLDDNQLSGPIPVELGNLSSLRRMHLHDNQLSGPIPIELGNLSTLWRLRLENNQLSGPIPVELGNLSNLRDMHLHDNQLSGPIPAELGYLSNLERLDLSHNELSGLIPTELGNLSSLGRLDLSYGQIWCMANSSGGDRLFRFTLFDFNPVPELHTLNDFGQVVKAA